MLARTLALIIHELATNAANKELYQFQQASWRCLGALMPFGFESPGKKGGRLVVPPTTTRRGFGTMFIKRLLSGVQGNVETEFCPTGVVCNVSFVLSHSEVKPNLL